MTDVILPSCPIPEVARLGRTLRAWKAAILAYFDTNGASNGPAEAIDGVIETTHRIARGFYRLKCLPQPAATSFRIKQTNHA